MAAQFWISNMSYGLQFTTFTKVMHSLGCWGALQWLTLFVLASTLCWEDVMFCMVIFQTVLRMFTVFISCTAYQKEIL